jgi:hypothetical protein
MKTKRKITIVSCAVSWFMLHGATAHACQVCTAIGLYDAFRFGVVWFYLLPIWTVIALVADREVSKKLGSQKPDPHLFSKEPLTLLFPVTGVLSLIGVHFLALLYFPFLLLPYCLSPRWLSREISRQRLAFAPEWFRRAAKGMAAVLLLSIVPAYLVFPLMHTEAQTRSLLSRTRADMRTTATPLEQYRQEFKVFPPARIEQHDGESYSILDVEAVKETSPQINEELLRDPFAPLQRRSLPRVAGLAAFFPYSLLGANWDAIESAPTIFDKIQYLRTPWGYVLWARGPDGVFCPGLCEAVVLKGAGSTTASVALVNMTYDPTNGTVSAGDIYILGPRN